MSEWRIDCFPPRFHVHYFQAVGALAVMSAQGKWGEGPTARLDRHGAGAFVFDIEAAEADAFWRETYRPSAVYAPWNALLGGDGVRQVPRGRQGDSPAGGVRRRGLPE